MLKSVFLTYLDSIRLLLKKPSAVILLSIFIAINLIPSIVQTKFGLLTWAIESLSYLAFVVYLYWVVFRENGVTSSTLRGWFEHYFVRTLTQYVAAIFLAFPVFILLKVTLNPVVFSVPFIFLSLILIFFIWLFISANLSTLWLCYKDGGILQNIINAGVDFFKNSGFYTTIILITQAILFISWKTLSDFASAAKYDWRVSIVTAVIAPISWMACAIGFLKFRERDNQLSITEN